MATHEAHERAVTVGTALKANGTLVNNKGRSASRSCGRVHEGCVVGTVC